MDAGELDQVITIEMRLMQLAARSDSTVLDELLDDDFVEIGASGRRWARSEIISDLIANPVLDVEVVDLSARHIDERIVLVTYTTLSPARRVMRSSWWRRTDDAWRCVFHQGTIATHSLPPKS